MFNLVVSIATVIAWVFIAFMVNTTYRNSMDCDSAERLKEYIKGLMTDYWFIFIVLMLNLISNIISAVGRL